MDEKLGEQQKTLMNDFFIALQFLTRINLVRQTVWTEEGFGKSVKFFPAVGAVLGFFYVSIIFSLIFFTQEKFSIFIGATGFFLSVILTGGIHFDGLADSADGLFSGREKEKILEIMKDSRAGSFGVLSLILVAVLQISSLAELAKISTLLICAAVYSAPIIGRLAMVFIIKFFPYARAQGIGKAFSIYATKKIFYFALAETILFLLPLIFFGGEIFCTAVISLAFAVIFSWHFGKFSTEKIGGVTGDIYGATEIISETLTLIIFLLTTNFLS
ncbi:MAG: adenosylcobinamide-GDP ribazoletransferase [Selenomonadaceae bacterium]|nr:adenosylcobinamide-GDP ribazoletransferase [Selenomonadaceae bacterium]